MGRDATNEARATEGRALRFARSYARAGLEHEEEGTAVRNGYGTLQRFIAHAQPPRSTEGHS
jgi:hypothetical protein